MWDEHGSMAFKQLPEGTLQREGFHISPHLALKLVTFAQPTGTFMSWVSTVLMAWICIGAFKKYGIITSNTYFHFMHFESFRVPRFVGEKWRLTKVEDFSKVTQTLNDRAGHLILSLGQYVSTQGNCTLQGTCGNV